MLGISVCACAFGVSVLVWCVHCVHLVGALDGGIVSCRVGDLVWTVFSCPGPRRGARSIVEWSAAMVLLVRAPEVQWFFGLFGGCVCGSPTGARARGPLGLFALSVHVSLVSTALLVRCIHHALFISLCGRVDMFRSAGAPLSLRPWETAWVG